MLYAFVLDTIDKVEYRDAIYSGKDWNKRETTNGHVEMIFEYRLVCDLHYYGPGCDIACTPRDDLLGHYTCNNKGQKECLPGWKGKFCEESKINCNQIK